MPVVKIFESLDRECFRPPLGRWLFLPDLIVCRGRRRYKEDVLPLGYEFAMIARRPYESETVRAVTGPAIRPGGLALTRRAAEVCGLGPGARVLDVGCGTGATVQCLQAEFGAAAIGMDLSPFCSPRRLINTLR